MSEHDLKSLLEAMPRIAEVVNKFKSEEVQKLAFQHCLRFLGNDEMGGDDPDVVTEDAVSVSKKKKRRPATSSKSDAQPPNREKGRKRKKASPSLVKDLNLRPANKKQLSDFFEEKQPQNNQKMFAVFVYYLKNEADVSEVTPDHIYTCFKHLKKPIPKNLNGALHTAANRDGYIDTSNIQDIQMTTHGENFVDHELPPKPKDGE